MNEQKIFELITGIETGLVKLTKNLPENNFSYLTNHYGNVEFKTDTGWSVTVFFDCGDWDYFDSFTDPDGNKLKYDNFSDELKNYRPEDEIVRVVYGGPGYLGQFMDLRLRESA